MVAQLFSFISIKIFTKFRRGHPLRDDTNLLVPDKTDVQLSAEFENILQWAADNLMTVNINKTKKIVFHRPSARHSTQLNSTLLKIIAAQRLD